MSFGNCDAFCFQHTTAFQLLNPLLVCRVQQPSYCQNSLFQRRWTHTHMHARCFAFILLFSCRTEIRDEGYMPFIYIGTLRKVDSP